MEFTPHTYLHHLFLPEARSTHHFLLLDCIVQDLGTIPVLYDLCLITLCSLCHVFLCLYYHFFPSNMLSSYRQFSFLNVTIFVFLKALYFCVCVRLCWGERGRGVARFLVMFNIFTRLTKILVDYYVFNPVQMVKLYDCLVRIIFQLCLKSLLCYFSHKTETSAWVVTKQLWVCNFWWLV